MSITSRLSLHFPASADTANIPNDIYLLANGLDGIVMEYFQQAYTGTLPTAVQGSLWWCTTTNCQYYGLNYFDGTAWHLLNNQIQSLSTEPSSPYQYQIYYNTTNGKFRYYNGSSWVTWFQIPPAGSANQVLTSTGVAGETSWQTAASIPALQGAQGSQGNQGYQGYQGAQGYQGQSITGAQGAQGYQGTQGTQGYQGYQGQSITGPQGTTGATGAQGPQGYQGNQGYQGVAGSGAQGAQGAQGPQGYQGNQGYQGVAGTVGTGTAGGDLTGSYPNPTLAAFGTAGTYAKVTTDSKGRVSSGTTLSASDIPSSLSSTTSVNNTSIPSGVTLLTSTTGQTIASPSVVSTGGTLFANQYNVYTGTSNTSLNMPTTASSTVGAVTSFFNNTTYTVTLNAQSGQTIYYYATSGSSFSVGPGQAVAFVYASGGGWYNRDITYGVVGYANGGTGVQSAPQGTGSVVLNVSPNLVTPSLGVATATSINGTTIPSGQTLLYSGGAAGTPSSIDLTNATNRFKNNSFGKLTAVSSSVIMTTSTNTLMSFDTQYFLSGGMGVYSPSAGIYTALVPTTPGYYQVSAQIYYGATATGIFQVQIWSGDGVNAVTQLTNSQFTPSSSNNITAQVNDIVYVDGSTVKSIHVKVRQTSGSSQYTVPSGAYNYLIATLIGQ